MVHLRKEFLICLFIAFMMFRAFQLTPSITRSLRSAASKRFLSVGSLNFQPHHIVGPNITSRFHHCALVGSGPRLTGDRSGNLIDSHDTVIRINRLPTQKQEADLGKKTDILFAGAVAEEQDKFQVSGYVVKNINASEKLCRYNETQVKTSCGFEHLVLNSGDLKTNKHWEEKYPKWNPGWRPNSSEFSITHQPREAYRAVKTLAKYALDHKRPTSGVQAFFSFAPLCTSMTLFGFGGSGTFDQHTISGKHNTTLEHNLIHNVLQGGRLTEIYEIKDDSHRRQIEALAESLRAVQINFY